MTSLLIVGNAGTEHAGRHFYEAAQELGVDVQLLDAADAWAGGAWNRRVHWHLLGKRPPALRRFQRRLLAEVGSNRPSHLLVVGLGPVTAATLKTLTSKGVATAAFLTDDPWSKANRSAFFLKAAPHYNDLFNPRRANMAELTQAGCRDVHYLPFAYNPTRHRPPANVTAEERGQFECDVAFIGGADPERQAILRPLVDCGLSLRIYGGGWHKARGFSTPYHGFALGREFQLAAACARVNIGLVRAANRDGHSMRSFEIPAVGGAMVAQDTEDHRQLFGAEGDCVSYFGAPQQLLDKVSRLVRQPRQRMRMAANGRRRVTDELNATYARRLQTILNVMES